MYGANPHDKHPLPGFPQVCFIKNTISNPKIIVGDYTYYGDPEDSENFERNVLYHYPFSRDKLIIGKFCSLARGVKFIMNGANHQASGCSSYPFYIFGNNVWLGYETTIMPGIKIRDGAIVAAKSVVARDVPAYSVVGGNPARVIRLRFSEETISQLLKLAW